MKVIGRLKFNLHFVRGILNKHQRALKAAKAAKRLPIVGAAVTLEPLLESAVAGFGTSINNVFTMAGWQQFLSSLKFHYAGIVPNSSNIDGGRLIQTYLPIGIYLLARKTGLSKPITKVLGRFGLRF